MLAVIETGGKQYLVTENQKLKIEKIKNLKEGDKVNFDKVLLLVDEKENVKIGKPYLENALVVGEVLKIGRGKKIIVFRYHSKTRYRKN
jgi:large subunit ribosomal protein L21